MQNIQSLISTSIKSLYNIDFIPEISPAPKPELGEYCIGVFQLAKPLSKAPNQIATELATELTKHTETFTSANSIGGYVNFFLTDSVWLSLFANLNQPTNPPTHQPTVVVDYIGANIGKPLHIWHLCTPSIGQSIINVYRHLGYHVIGDTHVWDWGLFGKLIAAHKRYGTPDGLEKKWVEYLLELYIDITARAEQDPEVEQYCRDEFKKLSEWDGESMKLWGEFTSVSLKSMNKILKLIHVLPDYDIGESFYENLPLPKIGNQPPLKYDMNSIVTELLEKKIATKNEDGSVAVIFPEETKLPSVVIQKKNGTNLYLTADVCAIKYRLNNGWNPSKIIYSVDLRQQLHFKQCFEICRMAGWTENVELFHAGNGHISLPDGAMSTRKGNIIRLEDLVNEAFERTKEILEEKWRTWEKSLRDEDIREIAVWAIKYSYLMQDRERNIVFDWDKALNFEGNSGPYIQYAYVRAKKILPIIAMKEAIQEINIDSSSWLDRRASLAMTDTIKLSSYDKSLIQSLARFDEMVMKTATSYKPHHLALFAYELAVTFNGFYVHTPKILEESDENVKNFRLSLVTKTVEILKESFELLGIRMPIEM